MNFARFSTDFGDFYEQLSPQHRPRALRREHVHFAARHLLRRRGLLEGLPAQEPAAGDPRQYRRRRRLRRRRLLLHPKLRETRSSSAKTTNWRMYSSNFDELLTNSD